MIINGVVGNRNDTGMIMRIDEVNGKKCAVAHTYRTNGFEKIRNWPTGTSFSIEVRFEVGPEALIITEII